jgi:hypothetical protein
MRGTNSVAKQFDIVIPCYNNLELTKECVESLKEHTASSFRLVLVNDASTDDTEKYFMELEKDDSIDVRVITQKKNFGFTKSVTNGLRSSKAPYVVVLNNDIIVKEEWTKSAKELFKKKSSVGIIGPIGHVRLDDERYRWAYKEEGSFKFKHITFVSGSRTIIKREVINKIGYYDSVYSPGYYEDVDFSLRAVLAGFDLYKYVIPSEHKRSATFKESKWNISEIQSNNRKYLLRKFRRFLTTGKFDREDIFRA